MSPPTRRLLDWETALVGGIPSKKSANPSQLFPPLQADAVLEDEPSFDEVLLAQGKRWSELTVYS